MQRPACNYAAAPHIPPARQAARQSCFVWRRASAGSAPASCSAGVSSQGCCGQVCRVLSSAALKRAAADSAGFMTRVAPALLAAVNATVQRSPASAASPAASCREAGSAPAAASGPSVGSCGLGETGCESVGYSAVRRGAPLAAPHQPAAASLGKLPSLGTQAHKACGAPALASSWTSCPAPSCSTARTGQAGPERVHVSWAAGKLEWWQAGQHREQRRGPIQTRHSRHHLRVEHLGDVLPLAGASH